MHPIDIILTHYETWWSYWGQVIMAIILWVAILFFVIKGIEGLIEQVRRWIRY